MNFGEAVAKRATLEELLKNYTPPEQPRGGREASETVLAGAGGLALNVPNKSLPDGWRWLPLLFLARQETGHTPSRSHPEYWDGGIPWMGIRDAGAHHGGEIFETEQTVSALGLANSAARLLPKGTICLSRTASVGYVTVLGREMATSQDFATWTCGELIAPRYLMYTLLAEGDDIRRFGKGTTHTTIYFPEIRAMHIALPPPWQQVQIVEKLDSLMAQSREAASALSRFESLITRYKAAVLKRCFDRAAKKIGTVSDFAEIQLGKMLDKAKNKGVLGAYLRNINVRWGSFDLDDLKEMRFETDEFQKFGIEDGDILLCEGGEPGRCAVWRNGSTNVRFQKALMRLRCFPDNVPEYLYYQMYWLAETHQLEEHFTGTTIKHLPQRALAAIPISIHTVSEQIEIVERIEAAFAQIDTLTRSVTAARARLKSLDRCVLAKAFRGELVLQDLNDKPASELLKRLKEVY